MLFNELSLFLPLNHAQDICYSDLVSMVRTPKIEKIYYDLIIEFKMQRSLLETYLQTER